MKLHYYYDKEADILYFSQGKPSGRDETIEASNDILLRINPKSKAVKGITVLNLSKRQKQNFSVPLPVQIQMQMA